MGAHSHSLKQESLIKLKGSLVQKTYKLDHINLEYICYINISNLPGRAVTFPKAESITSKDWLKHCIEKSKK